MKFEILFGKQLSSDIYCKLPVPLICFNLPKKVLHKLAKRHHVTTLEELLRVEPRKIENWQNKKHVKAVLKLIRKTMKRLRISMPSKENYHEIRRQKRPVLFFLKQFADLLVTSFFTVYHLIIKYKPLRRAAF